MTIQALPMEKIGNLVSRAKTWNPPRDAAGQRIRYIDLGSVDNEAKVITGHQDILANDAPSRARQLVQAGDILVSTVRPNLNGVARVPEGLDGATVSTGFCVLRAGDRRIVPEYLFHWVKTQQFVADMEKKATGQSYPAVSDRIISESEIPLPPVDEQRRIAAILDQADTLRRKRRDSLRLVDDLLVRIFEAMFGDLVENDRQWPIQKINSFVDGFQSGKNLVADDQNIANPRYRVLKVSAVTALVFKPEQSKALPDGYNPPSHHMVTKGDLLFSRANTAELIGATAVVDCDVENLVLPDKIWRFRWFEDKRANPLFVWFLFRQPSFREQIRQRSTGTSGSMKNISQDNVLNLEVGFPPIQLQNEFAQKLDSTRLIYSRQAEQRRALEDLFASLQHRAFRGEL